MPERTVGLDPTSRVDGAWTVKMDGPNQDRMRERLSNIEAEARTKIFHTAAKILGQCPSPAATGGRVTGLALGKVQSGKTSSFITLAAQAFDNGYKAVVVLAGTKTNLLRQNRERIQAELEDGREMEMIVLTTEREANTLRSEDVIQLVQLGRPVLITILKHPIHLKQVANVFRHPDLVGLPVMVIDDEGDQASLTTKQPAKRGRGTAAVATAKRTPTNEAIGELRDALSHHAFIAYTATPQANLLISTLDELSPEFCVLVEPGPGYTGGSTFHGPDQDLYVREVHLEENLDVEEGSAESLELALATFFVGATIRRNRHDQDYHSMLVHTSHRQTDHGDARALVKGWVRDWGNYLALPEGDPVKNALITLLQQGYHDLATTVQDDLPSWESVVERLPEAVKDCKVWVVNSSDQGEIFDPKRIRFRNNIFIGGNMLDRGVTVPGLAVTYITRWAKENQADTVEQRARWFGYKHKYLDVCRIWAPRPVLDGFSALLGHEDDLWRSLHLWEQTNHSVKEWPRLLRLDDPSLKPTRSSVASFSEVSQSPWTIQLRPAAEFTDAEMNMKAVRDFFASVGATTTEFGRQSHQLATNVRRSKIQADLLNRLRQVDSGWRGPVLEAWMARLAEAIPLDELDVIWIEFDQKRVRSRRFEDGSIPRLLQGYQKNYPGDRELRERRPQLQVHTPMLTNSGDDPLHQAVLLAFFIPGADEVQMRLVRGNG